MRRRRGLEAGLCQCFLPAVGLRGFWAGITSPKAVSAAPCALPRRRGNSHKNPKVERERELLAFFIRRGAVVSGSGRGGSEFGFMRDCWIPRQPLAWISVESTFISTWQTPERASCWELSWPHHLLRRKLGSLKTVKSTTNKMGFKIRSSSPPLRLASRGRSAQLAARLGCSWHRRDCPGQQWDHLMERVDFFFLMCACGGVFYKKIYLLAVMSGCASPDKPSELLVM